MQKRFRRGGRWPHAQLRNYGYRVTEARRAILGVLSRTNKHLSAEEIYNAVNKINPSSGIATVYRTLELLVQLKLVYKFDFGDGWARYELNIGDKERNHHHLICIRCKRVINYTDFIDDEIALLKRIEKGLSEKYNFKITKHILQFYGICKECQGK